MLRSVPDIDYRAHAPSAAHRTKYYKLAYKLCDTLPNPFRLDEFTDLLDVSDGSSLLHPPSTRFTHTTHPHHRSASRASSGT